MRSECPRSILAERRRARRAFPPGQPPAHVAAAAPPLVTLARATALASSPLLAAAPFPAPPLTLLSPLAEST